jgi:hypothetical protein
MEIFMTLVVGYHGYEGKKALHDNVGGRNVSDRIAILSDGGVELAFLVEMVPIHLNSVGFITTATKICWKITGYLVKVHNFYGV